MCVYLTDVDTVMRQTQTQTHNLTYRHKKLQSRWFVSYICTNQTSCDRSNPACEHSIWPIAMFLPAGWATRYHGSRKGGCWESSKIHQL